MRLNRISKRKAARLKWSRNANAAKARKRMERIPDRWPKMIPLFPWKLRVTNTLDGASVDFKPRSGRHAKAFLDALFAGYQAG